MDFSLIMLVALIVTGGIWIIDRLFLVPGRRRAAEMMKNAGAREDEIAKVRKESVLVEYARAFFPVILIVFLLRSFLVEPFRIPSGSMLPSLLVGDFILVNKYQYGIRLPVVNTKILDMGQPKRGDVMVFRFPGDKSVNYIKRVIGLPGDHVEYRDKKLYINGAVMDQNDSRPYKGRLNIRHSIVESLTEDLGNMKHDILNTDREYFGPTEFNVPKGQYFVMGDNRDYSNDSRYWGYVPDENLVGKAFLVWFSWDIDSLDKEVWEKIVWERIGNSIH